jgi:TatD DNase family protein
MIDIGVNLTNTRFNKDLPDVIHNAQQAGVTGIIITGTDLDESRDAIALAETMPDFLFTTAGIHPHDAKHFDHSSITSLRKIANNPQVKAIGECGLDFNRNFSTPKEQEYAFVQQLELAVELQLPVFMHERDASDRFIALLTPYRRQLPNALIHCFTGNKESLQRYIELDLHIGVTGWICDERRGTELLALVKHVPDHRLMIETDAPYLLPRSMRPKPKSSRNEPKYLPFIAETIALARQQSLEALINQTTKNSQEFFNLPIKE